MIGLQLAPAAALPLLHRSSVAPVQEPTVPDNVCPTWAVPLTVGGAVLRGTLPPAITAAVWAELAGWLGPAVLLAVTWSRSVKPRSAATGT